ncbi:MAG TPA: S53 family peptidase [Solirubrobacteraceae bacterium]
MQTNWVRRSRPQRVWRQSHGLPRTGWLVVAPLACLVAASAAASSGTVTSAATAPLNCAPPGVKQPPCYSPRAYQVAYGVSPLLRRGINGQGETVVVPEIASSPPSMDIRKDLATFDSTFGLPPAKLHVVNTFARSKTPYLADDEEVEDTEMVHAIAPGATLAVVLLPQDSNADSAKFFTTAATKLVRAGIALHAAVISISASAGEHFFTRAEAAQMHAAMGSARDHRLTVVVSSGDLGAISDGGPPKQVSLPASDPLVLAVGGTILDAARPGGTYLGEMAWNGGSDGSAGGYSSLFARPAYQDGVTRAAKRGVPDVAANADSATAMALEYSDHEFRAATGTSASTPLWAGVIALADQAAHRHLGFVNPTIYAIARTTAYHRAFHDVVTGDNSVLWSTGVVVGYNSRPGWDPVTGLGSPDAQHLVPLLAGPRK